MEMSLETASMEYVFRRKHGKIHIKKYIGKGGIVEIPQLIGGMPVTKIGFSAFNNSDITEVIIPDGVRCIGTMAFAHCKHLKKVTFKGRIDVCDFHVFYNSGIEEIVGIEFLVGSGVKIDCFDKTPFYEANESLIIGDKLVWCRDDSEIIRVPDHVRRIGYMAFYSSKSKKIILPEGLEAIDNLVFYMANIKEIDVPDNVQKLGGGVFSGCCQLETVRFPQDFGRRIGWSDYLGVNKDIINDTQMYPATDDDVLVYDDVSCITCSSAMRYGPVRLREKQIFPERLQYLKCVKLLASSKVNVFKNDTFKIERDEYVFEDYAWYANNAGRRFKIVFDLEDAYAEVLFFFPFMPYWFEKNNWKKHSGLLRFYEHCLTNAADGKFFDFERYDGNILEQDIPFRIKAEIAYKRFESNYRLSDEAKEKYRSYFRFHRKKLYTAFEKMQDEKIKNLFEEIIL